MKSKFVFLICILFALFSCSSNMLYAQSRDLLFLSEKKIDEERKGELRIDIENINFFKNNEFTGNVVKGYSLPGFILQPKAVYYPLSNLKLELGIHALAFHGAERYPMKGYSDIAEWKDSKYQYGLHLTTWFRAHLELSDRVGIILGNIYGGANHRLIEPLYAPELNLTADPETGLQVLLDMPVLDLDAWVNWQSFIFKGDNHQEAFIVGLSSQIKFNSPKSKFHFYMPIQGIAQHRGGEIDNLTTSSVQTFMNGAAGFGVQWNNPSRSLHKVGLGLYGTGYYQQAGELWPLESGYGSYGELDIEWKDFYFKAGYWESSKFISILGFPYYGSVSSKIEDAVFDFPRMLTFNLEYTRSFGKITTLGIGLNVYHRLADKMLSPEAGWSEIPSETGFTVGIALRVNPSFLLKKFD